MGIVIRYTFSALQCSSYNVQMPGRILAWSSSSCGHPYCAVSQDFVDSLGHQGAAIIGQHISLPQLLLHTHSLHLTSAVPSCPPTATTRKTGFRFLLKSVTPGTLCGAHALMIRHSSLVPLALALPVLLLGQRRDNAHVSCPSFGLSIHRCTRTPLLVQLNVCPSLPCALCRLQLHLLLLNQPLHVCRIPQCLLHLCRLYIYQGC